MRCRSRLAEVVAVAVLASPLAACVMRETSLIVETPGARPVALRSRVTENAPVVLASAGEPGESRLSRGDVATGPQTSAAYEAHAVRAEDGALELRWETHLPLALGERITLLPASGILDLPLPDESPAPVTFGPEVAAVGLCVQLERHLTRGATEYRSVLAAPSACERPLSVPGVALPIELDFPRQGLVVRQVSHPMRGVAGALVALDVLVFGAVGVPFVAEGSSLGSDGKGLTIAGASLLAVGGVFAAFLLPTFFASDEDRSLVPRHDFSHGYPGF